MRMPDFDNIKRILNREKPKRATLFEFFLNIPLYGKLAKYELSDVEVGTCLYNKYLIKAFGAAGYDYVTLHPPIETYFPRAEHECEDTISLNDSEDIYDRESFEAYEWPDPDKADYSFYDRLGEFLPSGMKAMVCCPGGVLENVIRLIGYDKMCFMTVADPELLNDVFAKVGSVLVRHCEIASQFEGVGMIMSNDDWGFNTQTMLSPADFEKYLFPWHRKIAAAAHKSGKFALLHSCGNLREVMDVIIDDIGYDGKHSYEDAIQPIEEAYEEYHSRIALLGGIDLDFVCRRSPAEVYERSQKMLERSAEHGAYALGTGNSVPEYAPEENYFAMTRAALE
jgi:uroporphyrinogen decarboxylase